MENVDVIILSNAYTKELEKVTRKSLSLLKKSEEGSSVNLIPLVIEQNPNVKYDVRTIYKTEEFNYNKFMNFGLENTNSEYVAMCNNDLFYRQYWATMLLKTMKKYNFLSASPIDPLHQKYNDAIYAKGFEKGHIVNRHVNGFCIMINRKLLNIIEKLDEESPFWGADVNFAKQLITHNIEHALVSSSRVIHLNHTTLNTFPIEKRNKLKTFV